MPSLNFQKQFAPAVKAGTKRQTIRAYGKRKPFKKGDTLYLFTGMRTRSCERLGTAVCACVSEIIIKPNQEVYMITDMSQANMGYTGNFEFQLNKNDLIHLAKKDGFKTRAKFISFFEETYGLPFKGQLINW